MNTVAIASDHRGVAVKEACIDILKDLCVPVADLGPTRASEGMPQTKEDYPDYAVKVADSVANNQVRFGILICGTGIGMSIAANKVVGVRAALCRDVNDAKLTRKHNDANILCLGAENCKMAPNGGYVDDSLEQIINMFLVQSFEGERHAIRVDKIKDIELADHPGSKLGNQPNE